MGDASSMSSVMVMLISLRSSSSSGNITVAPEPEINMETEADLRRSPLLPLQLELTACDDRQALEKTSGFIWVARQVLPTGDLRARQQVAGAAVYLGARVV